MLIYYFFSFCFFVSIYPCTHESIHEYQTLEWGSEGKKIISREVVFKKKGLVVHRSNYIHRTEVNEWIFFNDTTRPLTFSLCDEQRGLGRVTQIPPIEFLCNKTVFRNHRGIVLFKNTPAKSLVLVFTDIDPSCKYILEGSCAWTIFEDHGEKLCLNPLG